MTTKPLLLTVLVLVFCCVSVLHGSRYAPRRRTRCSCRILHAGEIPIQQIWSVEVIPVSGSCRQAQIIVYKKNGQRVCVDPESSWISRLVEDIKRRELEAEAMASGAALNATSAAPDWTPDV